MKEEKKDEKMNKYLEAKINLWLNEGAQTVSENSFKMCMILEMQIQNELLKEKNELLEDIRLSLRRIEGRIGGRI